MTDYTLHVFDGDPAVSGDCRWPDEYAVSDPGELRSALATIQDDASGCGEYTSEDRIWWILFDADDMQVDSGSFFVGAL